MAKRQHTESNEDNLKELVSNSKYCKNTMYTDKVNEKSLRNYVESKNGKKLEELSKEELNKILGSYFVSIRKPDGEKYMKQTLDGIKYSLGRVLNKLFGAECYDINKDKEFASFREIYYSFCKTLKAEGKHVVRHYDQIPSETIAAIIEKLDPTIATQLQLLVWIFVMLYFCRRGLENVELMTKRTFEIRKNEAGRRYLVQCVDEATKNHKTDGESSIGGRIYEQAEMKKCPIKLYEIYISKLNDKCDRLWQRAKDSYLPNESTWFQNRPIGKSTIAKFMNNICHICDIGKKYTNHCLRVSAINILKSNFSDKNIMAISGHKSLASLSIYERTSEKKKESMSDCISSFLDISTSLEGDNDLFNMDLNIASDIISDTHLIPSSSNINAQSEAELNTLLDCEENDERINHNIKCYQMLSNSKPLQQKSYA